MSAHDRERALLGALLADNAQVRQISLTPTDFVVASHAQIFDVTRRLIGSGTVADALTVAEALDAETGRREWLQITAALVSECLSPANAPAYASLIRKASIARQASAIGERLAGSPGADEIASAIRDLMALSTTDRDYSCHVLDAMQEAINELSQATEGKLPGVGTGIKDLDEALGGLHSEDLIIVAARPAMGKTAFMLNLASAADRGVGVISGEQGRSQIGMRLFSMDGPVSLHRMRTGALTDDEWSRVSRVMRDMKGRRMWLFDKPAPTVADIVSQARAWKFHNDIGVLMIDYLQKIRGGAGENFRLQVGDITAQLKDLARELKIPVVVLAQAKRDVETRQMGSDGLGRMPYHGDIA
jgi:replicative DNA helicase